MTVITLKTSLTNKNLFNTKNTLKNLNQILFKLYTLYQNNKSSAVNVKNHIRNPGT